MEQKLKAGQRIDIYKVLNQSPASHINKTEFIGRFMPLLRNSKRGVYLFTPNRTTFFLKNATYFVSQNPLASHVECRKVGCMVIKKLKKPKHETTE
jgi:hypothetical protein